MTLRPGRARRSLLPVALPALLLPLLLLAAPALAQDSGWSEPVSLGRYWFPDVAADAQGRAHIAWSSGLEGYDTVMYAVWSEDEGMSAPVDVQAQAMYQGSEASRPNLYSAPDGIMHMTYRFTGMHYSQAPAAAVLSPRAWSQPALLADAGYFTAITADSTGVLHLLTTQNVSEENCAICLHLFYRNSQDNGFTWSEPQDLSLARTGTAKPQMIVDAADTLHVVYESGYGGTLGQLSGPTEVRYVRSTDGGESWSAPETLDAPAEPGVRPASHNIAIAADRDGRLLVVFLDANRSAVFYRLSEDGGESWSDARLVPSVFGAQSANAPSLDIYSMARDSLGIVHLVMVGRLNAGDPGYRLLHLAWDGAGWGNPVTIAAYGEDRPEWPRVAVGNGNRLYVVWFVRNAAAIFQSDGGDYQVYFATRRLDAPAATPTPFSVARRPPQALPLPVVGVAGVASPAPATPTPLSAAFQRAPGNPALVPNLASENDDVLLIVVATLPAALLILALAFVRRMRLRRRQP